MAQQLGQLLAAARASGDKRQTLIFSLILFGEGVHNANEQISSMANMMGDPDDLGGLIEEADRLLSPSLYITVSSFVKACDEASSALDKAADLSTDILNELHRRKMAGLLGENPVP